MLQSLTLFKFFVMLLAVTLPLIIHIYYRYISEYKIHSCLLWLVGILIFWLSIQLGVYIIDKILYLQLTAFDLDSDGIFSDAEMSTEASQAMHRVINDTGRTLAPITGAIAAVIYNSFIWMLFIFADSLYYMVKSKKKKL